MRRWIVASAFAVALSFCIPHTAAQSADPKNAFVRALGDFSLALDGTAGDEGPRILSSLEALERALSAWDQAIAGFESDAARNPPSDPRLAARMHVALGGLYLDRGRHVDAMREFDAAATLDSSRPDAYVLRGLAGLAARDAEGAVASFRTAVAADPRDTAAAYLLARALSQAGHPDEARAAFRTVTAEQASNGDRRTAASAPFMRFGIVEERSGVEPFFPPAAYADGFKQLERGDLARAIAALHTAAGNDALVSGEADRSYAVRSAAGAVRDGDISTAIAQLHAAIEVYPESAEPHRLLGLAYASDEQYERAVAELKIAIAASPGDERARLALADVLTQSDDAPAAEQALQAAIAAIPASGRAHYVLARVYQRQAKQSEALRELQIAITFAPLVGVNGLYQTIGALAAARQDFDAAIAAYSSRVDLQPNDAGAHQDLGDTYARLGRSDEAFAELSVSLMLDPSRAAAHASLAQLHLRNAQYEAAASEARRAVDLDPGHRQARYSLGTALVRLGRAEEGQKELEEFQRLQSLDAAARARDLELGGLRREATISSAAGDHQKAVALLRKALQLEPDNAVSYLNLGMALVLAGQPAEAVEQLTKAASLNAPIEVHRQLAEAYAALGRAADNRREMDIYEQAKRSRLRTAADR